MILYYGFCTLLVIAWILNTIWIMKTNKADKIFYKEFKSKLEKLKCL